MGTRLSISEPGLSLDLTPTNANLTRHGTTTLGLNILYMLSNLVMALGHSRTEYWLSNLMLRHHWTASFLLCLTIMLEVTMGVVGTGLHYHEHEYIGRDADREGLRD